MSSHDQHGLLFVTHRVPFPPDKGDRIRTYHMLRFLAGRFHIHLACLADEAVPAAAAAELNRYCARVAIIRLGATRWWHGLTSFIRGDTITEGIFHSSELCRLLESWAGETRFSAALVSSSGLVPYLRSPRLRSVPAVVDLMDVDSQKWLDFAAASRGPRSWLYGMEGRRLRRLEAGLPGEFHAVTLVSTAERDLYLPFCVPGRIEAISNGVDLDYFQPAPLATEAACVFVGALDYRPNIDGIEWFCRSVWPDVRTRRPDAELRIVGRRPVRAVRALGGLPGVAVIGTVPDVRPHVHNAAVAVVPLRFARGLQNKVLEALAMAKATVASPPALAALAVEPGVHVLAASTAAEWTTAVLRLLDDGGYRQQLGAAGRRYVEEHHSWDRCLEPLLGLLAVDRQN